MLFRSQFWINATDPASACGLGVEGLQVDLPARLKTTRLLYHGARLAAVLRKSGKEWDIHLPPNDPALTACLDALGSLPPAHANNRSGMTVELINAVPAVKSAYLPALREHFTAVADARRVTLYALNASRT